MLAYLPAADDNVAIATQSGEIGGRCNTQYGRQIELMTDVPVGYRLAVREIKVGEKLYSWGHGFGIALQDIEAGTVVCNRATIEAISNAGVTSINGIVENFSDYIPELNRDAICVTGPRERDATKKIPTIMGFQRNDGRGVGTRNYIAVIATSSMASTCARLIAERVRDLAWPIANFDGVVCVAHTEGAHQYARNTDLVVRTLAGFLLHPNLGRVLLIDHPDGHVNTSHIVSYLRRQHRGVIPVHNQSVTVGPNPNECMDHGSKIVLDWVHDMSKDQRSLQPVSSLKIALQCGGSDAFSGITGNPLVSHVAAKLIGHGGAANISETPELVGAEAHVLHEVANLRIADEFLERVERFKNWIGEHGHSAEGNPSYGNRIRGLYNIALKSLGAGMKRAFDIPLEYVIDYSSRMHPSGLHFMDSPGNDIESVCGQVASGCNLIMFVTGSGSVTNFPFVPTVKIVTTTSRYDLLSNDMDVNAGSMLEGGNVGEASSEFFELVRRIASGERTAGELAGHSQVQIWRNWSDLSEQVVGPATQVRSLGVSLQHHDLADNLVKEMKLAVDRPATIRYRLILPTSLCSGQVANLGASRLNEKVAEPAVENCYVSLGHTEGCGVSSGSSEELLLQILCGYLSHPLVSESLVLEHGCEKVHAGYLRQYMLKKEMDPSLYGWASVQKDGGVERVLRKIEEWFTVREPNAGWVEKREYGNATMRRIALFGCIDVNPDAGKAFASLCQLMAAAGVAVILPKDTSLLKSNEFVTGLFSDGPPSSFIPMGFTPTSSGVYIMDTQTDHILEVITGMGASGVELFIAYTGPNLLQGHPFIPMLQVGERNEKDGVSHDEVVDLQSSRDHVLWMGEIIEKINEIRAGTCSTSALKEKYVDFQIPRSPSAVSM